MRPYPPIGDYAVIGDCRSVALISRSGSLDWLCLPRFDSPSIFAALLDSKQGGCFRVCTVLEAQTARRYLPDTNILETTFRVAGGAAVLRDLMPVSSEEDKQLGLNADHEILRELEGLEGQVELEIVYEPRPDYGRTAPKLKRRGELGLWSAAKDGALALSSDFPLHLAADSCSATAVVSIHAGERKYLSLIHEEEGPAAIPPLGKAARQRIERTGDWWRGWVSRCTYRGPYREQVIRSALTLKLMSYAPSGAVIAAPTTSLPEAIGGVRNWDYRYCWLRDASFTLRSLFSLGYDEEAQAFLSWMLQATRLTWPELQVVYDVFGEARLPEKELRHLQGYAQSRPVRIGNDAHAQLQLDVYGEVIDAAAQFVERGGSFDRETRRMLVGLGETVCKRWHEPDDGIWEARGTRAHHTHSKVLCWVALDRLIRMHEGGHLVTPIEKLRRYRAMVRAAIEARGFNEEIGSYASVLGGNELDASLLTLPIYGYVAADHPRMRATYNRIREKLGRGDLIFRYGVGVDDGLPPGEAAFGICSFWAVEYLARGGQAEAASRGFEHLCSYANDLGLFAEEIDPDTGALLGNFPQAFTHVGLINAALAIARACEADAILPREQSAVRGEEDTR